MDPISLSSPPSHGKNGERSRRRKGQPAKAAAPGGEAAQKPNGKDDARQPWRELLHSLDFTGAFCHEDASASSSRRCAVPPLSPDVFCSGRVDDDDDRGLLSMIQNIFAAEESPKGGSRSDTAGAKESSGQAMSGDNPWGTTARDSGDQISALDLVAATECDDDELVPPLLRPPVPVPSGVPPVDVVMSDGPPLPSDEPVTELSELSLTEELAEEILALASQDAHRLPSVANTADDVALSPMKRLKVANEHSSPTSSASMPVTPLKKPVHNGPTEPLPLEDTRLSPSAVPVVLPPAPPQTATSDAVAPTTHSLITSQLYSSAPNRANAAAARMAQLQAQVKAQASMSMTAEPPKAQAEPLLPVPKAPPPPTSAPTQGVPRTVSSEQPAPPAGKIKITPKLGWAQQYTGPQNEKKRLVGRPKKEAM